MKRHSYLYKRKKSHSRFARRPVYHTSVHVNSIENKAEVKKVETEHVNEVNKEPFKTRIHGFMERQRKYHSQEILHRKKKIEYAEALRKEKKQAVIDQKEILKDTKQQAKEQAEAIKQLKNEYKQSKKRMKQARKKNFGLPSSVLTALFTTFGIFIAFTVHWVFKTWPKLQMDELVYQLTSSIEGTGGGMIQQFIYSVLLPAMVFLGLIIGALVFLARSGKRVRKFGKCALNVVGVICLTVSSVLFCRRLNVLAYLENQKSGSDFIERNYADPSEVNMTFPEKKRNLVMIYLESMEMTYADEKSGGAFKQNVIPELTDLSNENENFSGDNSTLNGAVSLPGTTWTMGGLFASTSGLPLQIDIDGNNMDTQDSFFPGITNLGDILNDQGYRQIFECGSDAVFAGRKMYFQTHGNYEIHDINYYKQQGVLPEDYYVWWGFEDQKLIEYAKNELSELGESDQPFNYTMLTVDTHFEDGYVCDLCEDDFGDRYSNVMACSSRQVSELVSWIQQQDWYDNTTIVITGDHPTMDSDFCNDVPDTFQRRVYTAYINADPVENNSQGKRSFSTFDTFPTVIASLGVDIDGERLGLGTNLYSGYATLMEKSNFASLSAEVAKKSEFMSEKASLDQSSQSLLNRQGTYPCADVQLTSYNAESGKAEFIVRDIFNVNEEIQDIVLTVIDDSGKETVKKMKYTGTGTYESSVTIPNGLYSRLHVSVDADVKEDEPVNLFSYDGDMYLIASHFSDFERFLENMDQLDLNRYVVFMTSQGEVTDKITDEERHTMEEMGIVNLISEKQPAAYAVIDNTGIKTVNGVSYVRENGELDNGIPYVISSSYNDEQSSSIIVGYDYTDFSLHGNGINVVVYDKLTDDIVCQKVYDTGSYHPSAEVSATQKSVLKKNLELSVADISGANSVYRVLARIYDTSDPDFVKEQYLNLDLNINTDNKKTIRLNGKKETITQNTSETVYKTEFDMTGHNRDDIVVEFYVEDSGFVYHYLGTEDNIK